MARRPRQTRSARPRRQASANTAGLQLLSALIREQSVTTLRDIDPDIHMDQERGSYEQRAYDYIAEHHEEHRVLPTVRVIADNTGVVLPETDQPASYYFRRVRARGMVHNLTDPYNRLNDALQNPRQSVGEIEDSIDEMYRVRSRFMNSGTGSEMSDTILETIGREIQDRRMSSGMVRGITTGYEELDVAMDGYNRGDLVVWVGRPGRSKSWFLLKQCHAAWMQGYKPLYVSMEMGAEQNMRRILGIQSGINPTFIKRGQIQTLAQPHLDAAMSELLALRPLQMVTANFSRTVEQIANLVDQHNPDIIYIDAGYLLSPKKKRYGSSGRRETISDVVEELKELAANCDRPMVITVQFNRQAEHRRRSPQMDGGSLNPIGHLSLAEIGETDVIGQTATHVLGIEFPPDPLAINSHRVFGFLKGREGESGWWLTRFLEHRFSPVDLSLVPRPDPIYDLIHQAAQQRQSRGRRERDPSRRTQLMRLNDE